MFCFFFNSNSLFYKDEFIHPFSATAGGGVDGPIKIRLWAKVGWGCTSDYSSQGVLTLELADFLLPQIIKLYTVLGATSVGSENIVSAHVWMQVKLSI